MKGSVVVTSELPAWRFPVPRPPMLGRPSINGLRASFTVLVLLTMTAAFISACGSSTPATAAATAQPQPVDLDVQGSATTGVSRAFHLPAGTYDVSWAADAEAGCAIHLILTTSADGPVIREIVSGIASGTDAHGFATLSSVPEGTYIVQEDRSADLSCSGSFEATITTP